MASRIDTVCFPLGSQVLLLEIVTRIKGRKPDNELLSMRSPTYGEASAASISRYQTTQAGDKIFNSTSGVRSDLVPTYPLQSLRVGNDSEEGLSDPEKGFDHNPSQTTNTNIAFGGEGFEYASNTEVGRPYKGVYIQSQTS